MNVEQTQSKETMLNAEHRANSGSPHCSSDFIGEGVTAKARPSVDPLKTYRSAIANAEREADLMASDVQILKALALRSSEREVIAIGNLLRKLFS